MNGFLRSRWQCPALEQNLNFLNSRSGQISCCLASSTLWGRQVHGVAHTKNGQEISSRSNQWLWKMGSRQERARDTISTMLYLSINLFCLIPWFCTYGPSTSHLKHLNFSSYCAWGIVINAGWREVCSKIRLSDNGINRNTSRALL